MRHYQQKRMVSWLHESEAGTALHLALEEGDGGVQAEERVRSEPPLQHGKGGTSLIKRVLHWIKRGLQVLVIVLLTLAIAGAIYQTVATEIDQRKLGPAPGEMVSVGNHKLHINCIGQGSPTVITESGASGTSIEWSAWVQPLVAKATRVCAYECAGLGWSEGGPESRDARQIASELHTLLANADIRGPYVLVGHSVGGHYARVYADRYPEEVAGMVLVDSSHPEQFERIPGYESGLTRINVMSKVGPVLAAAGVIRLSGMFPLPSDLPPLQRKQGENLIYQTPHLMAAFKEFDALPKTMEQAHNSQGLGEKPLAVVAPPTTGAGRWRTPRPKLGGASERGRYCRRSWLTSPRTAPVVSSRDRITSQSSPTSVTPSRPVRRSSRWLRPCAPASRLLCSRSVQA
jgi:pimeloyl-ACP methyl ester carboxylesterase